MIATALAVALSGLLARASRGGCGAARRLAMTGFAGTLVNASCNTSLQLRAPDALRGRVMSL